MASIKSRVDAMAEIIRQRQSADEGPVDELSQSLFSLEDELLSLDELGKAAFLAELNQEKEDGSGSSGLALEGLEQWIADIRENRKIIW